MQLPRALGRLDLHAQHRREDRILGVIGGPLEEGLRIGPGIGVVRGRGRLHVLSLHDQAAQIAQGNLGSHVLQLHDAVLGGRQVGRAMIAKAGPEVAQGGVAIPDAVLGQGVHVVEDVEVVQGIAVAEHGDRRKDVIAAEPLLVFCRGLCLVIVRGGRTMRQVGSLTVVVRIVRCHRPGAQGP